MQKLLYEINHEYSLITYISDIIISLLKCTSYYVETLYYIIQCIIIVIRSIQCYSVILYYTVFIRLCRTGNCKPRLRERDSNPRHSAYETDNLTTDIPRINYYNMLAVHVHTQSSISFVSSVSC